MSDHEQPFKIDLRSTGGKKTPSAVWDFALPQTPETVSSRRWGGAGKLLATLLLAGITASPFSWVFADELPEPIPETVAPEPAPDPTPPPEPLESAETEDEGTPPEEEGTESEPPAEVVDTAEQSPPEEEVEDDQELPSNSTEPESPTVEENATVPALEDDEEPVASSTDLSVSPDPSASTTQPLASTSPDAALPDSSASTSTQNASSSPDSATTTATSTADSQPADSGTANDASGETGLGSAPSTDGASTSPSQESAPVIPLPPPPPGFEKTEAKVVPSAPKETATTSAEVLSEKASNNDASHNTEPEIVESKSFSADQSKYVFDVDDCIVVRDGEFFCLRENNKNDDVAAESSSGAVVVARKDAGGDKEIFIRTHEGMKQITSNTVDDDAPAFDAESGIVLWHSLVRDRYQIMAYIVATGETRQITDTSFNNTDPAIFGTTAVWQGWAGDDWDIFTADLSSGSGAVRQLTDNTHHDMFAKIYKNLITWQSNESGNWQAYVHDLATGITTHVGAGGEGALESPRFVLLVEKRNEQGDIEKIGYDVETGEEIPLGVTPKPADLPLPEPTPVDTGAMPLQNSTTTVKTPREGTEGDEPIIGGVGDDDGV